jgi:hypothetical protein
MRDNSGKIQRGAVSLGVLLWPGLVFVAALSTAAASAQGTTPGGVASDPIVLVRRAAANELRPGNSAHPYRYKLHKIDDGRSSSKEIVETKDGDVARIVEIGGHPVRDEANQNEIDRLNNLLAHPEVQEHRHKSEQADNNRADEMVRLLPDAFLYHFEGMGEAPSGPAYRLSLKPNPNFHPPDYQAEVYAGMAGELWIDQQQERMVKLDVHLIADVHFGWGILGKLDKGGTILVEQKDVGSNHWEQYHFKLDLHGKALLFKTLTFEITEDESDFVAVPTNWGYQDAVKMLLSLKPSDAGSSSLGGR